MVIFLTFFEFISPINKPRAILALRTSFNIEKWAKIQLNYNTNITSYASLTVNVIKIIKAMTTTKL